MVDTDTWLEIAKTQEIGQEDMIDKTEETDNTDRLQGMRALDAITVRDMVTWQETAREVSDVIDR